MFVAVVLALTAGFFLWMVVEPLLHEGAHLLAAKIVGFRPYLATIGQGPLLYSGRLGNIEVRFHMIPGSGSVRALPPMHGIAWRGAIFSIAGIATDVFLLILFVSLVDFRAQASHPGHSAPFSIFLTGLVMYQAWVIAVNAIPRDALVEGVATPNDGKQFLAYLTGTNWAMDYEGAVARYDPAFRIDDSWLMREDPAIVALYSDSELDRAAGRRNEGVQKAERILNAVTMHPAEKAALLDKLACLAVIEGDKTFVGQAEAWAKQACHMYPENKTLRGTLGSVLVEAGRYREGLGLLLPLTTEDNSPIDRTLAACFASKALHASGQTDEAAKMMQIARAAGLFGEVCARVQAELAIASDRAP